MATENSEKLRHKQQCANRLQSITQQQRSCSREIQRRNYKVTPELRAEIDRLIAEYDNARQTFDAAELECDIPVFVIPIR